MPISPAVVLTRLEAARRLYGLGGGKRVARLLGEADPCRFLDLASLTRFHDALLFLRAFPHSPTVARLAERLLAGIPREVERLRAAGAAMDLFASEEFSGVAGTALTDTFTYEVARWLVRRYPRQVSAEWEPEEQAKRMAASLPRFLPLLDDDALVEADTPYLGWLAGAAGAGRELPWLLERLERLPASMPEKTEIYDGLGVTLRWELGSSAASRTFARRRVRRMFCHDAPLIRRNQVSLSAELGSPPLPWRRMTPRAGETVLDMVREAVTVRYRELYGTTRGDAAHVYQADVGRGVQIFLWGLPPDRRLPLRAYHAGLSLKNGVPINYIEGISLFDWMEVGFNTFYAYRDGETAWIYSKAIHLLHQLTGITCISVYPYQLGHGNEEAIQSGAFWFYRKLGFRPGRPELLALARREEARMAADAAHRTSPRTLRRLAAGHVFYEFGAAPPGRWDTFSTRHLGLAVQRRMAADFNGDAGAMRRSASARLAQLLHVDPKHGTAAEQTAFANFAVVLGLLPELKRWTPAQKQALVRVIRAKAAPEETDYLRRLQRHPALQQAVRALGSARAPARKARG